MQDQPSNSPIAEKICRDCGTSKMLSEYTIKRSNADGYDDRCRECKRIRWSKYWTENRERMGPNNRAKVREWENNNREKRNETCRKAWAANRDQYRATSRKARIKLKFETINAYGGKCACCGESVLEFLTIDHVHGEGTKHRQTLKRGSGDLYRHLKSQEFPEGYQVLCWNCNFSKHYGGGICYHQRKSIDE